MIVDDPFSDFVTNVTICNNRQNPVESWNLRANDRIQCDLHDKFREQVRIYYSRQENAIRNLSPEDLDEMGIQDTKDICIRPLAQTFLAVQGEIGRMSHLPEVFENQKWYEETFRDSYLNADARKIVLAYKVHLVLKSPLQRLEEVAAQKMVYAVSKSRNLVWALLIQGVLNDKTAPDAPRELWPLPDKGSRFSGVSHEPRRQQTPDAFARVVVRGNLQAEARGSTIRFPPHEGNLQALHGSCVREVLVDKEEPLIRDFWAVMPPNKVMYPTRLAEFQGLSMDFHGLNTLGAT